MLLGDHEVIQVHISFRLEKLHLVIHKKRYLRVLSNLLLTAIGLEVVVHEEAERDFVFLLLVLPVHVPFIIGH